MDFYMPFVRRAQLLDFMVLNGCRIMHRKLEAIAAIVQVMLSCR